MSWEYTKYEATCLVCGQKGYRIDGMDDWCRTSTQWEGFLPLEPDSTAVGRMRASVRDARAMCSCGSSNIDVQDAILP